MAMREFKKRVKGIFSPNLSARDRERAFKYDVFICCAPKDWAAVYPCLQSLVTDRRLRFCVGQCDFMATRPRTLKNTKALMANSRGFLVVLSRQFADSALCVLELRTAVEVATHRSGKCLAAVSMDNVNVLADHFRDVCVDQVPWRGTPSIDEMVQAILHHTDHQYRGLTKPTAISSHIRQSMDEFSDYLQDEVVDGDFVFVSSNGRRSARQQAALESSLNSEGDSMELESSLEEMDAPSGGREQQNTASRHGDYEWSLDSEGNSSVELQDMFGADTWDSGSTPHHIRTESAEDIVQSFSQPSSQAASQIPGRESSPSERIICDSTPSFEQECTNNSEFAMSDIQPSSRENLQGNAQINNNLAAFPAGDFSMDFAPASNKSSSAKDMSKLHQRTIKGLFRMVGDIAMENTALQIMLLSDKVDEYCVGCIEDRTSTGRIFDGSRVATSAKNLRITSSFLSLCDMNEPHYYTTTSSEYKTLQALTGRPAAYKPGEGMADLLSEVDAGQMYGADEEIASQDDDDHPVYYDVYMDYATTEESEVSKLVDKLEALLGIRVWIKKRNLGEDLFDSIASAIRRSRSAVCIISRAYIADGLCMWNSRVLLLRSIRKRCPDYLILVAWEDIPSTCMPDILRLHCNAYPCLVRNEPNFEERLIAVLSRITTTS